MVGFVIYFATVPRLLNTDDPELMSFVLFFGVSQLIEAIAVIAFGTSQRSLPFTVFGFKPVPILGQTFPRTWVISAVISAVAIVAVFLYLRYTRLGYATRAIMSDRAEAASVGVTVIGPLIGTAVLYSLYNYIGVEYPQYFQLLYGLLIVLLILFLPGGLLVLARRRRVDVF